MTDIQHRLSIEKHMTSQVIQKYSKTTTANLKLRAQKAFNAWIRKRDSDQPCISCGKFTTLQAGHYHSAGKHNHLRFNEDNVNGQCLRCNYFDSSNALKYRMNLVKKIGEARVKKLDNMAMDRATHKNDRFYFIEIIEKYSQLLKQCA